MNSFYFIVQLLMPWSLHGHCSAAHNWQVLCESTPWKVTKNAIYYDQNKILKKMQILWVSPFLKLQSNTQTTVKLWKIRWRILIICFGWAVLLHFFLVSSVTRSSVMQTFFQRTKCWTPKQHNKTAQLRVRAKKYPTSHFSPFTCCLKVVL